MAKVRIVGAEVREGDFNGNHYKNYLVYYVPSVKKESEIFGVCPQFVKIKAKWFEDQGISIKSLDKKDVEFFYDSYGNVAKIEE